MNRCDYLIEIGVEELPPKSMVALIETFGDSLANELDRAQLEFDDVIKFATPRRLGLLVRQLADEQPEQSIEKRGPSIEAAFDGEGNPTKAAIGFARSCGLDGPEALEHMETDKGTWLVYRDVRPGESLQTMIQPILSRCLDTLPIERAMRWGTGRKAFVRPVHWIVSIYGEDILELELFGIPAGRESRGHRFMSTEPVRLDRASDYESALEQAGVVASFEARRSRISEQLTSLAATEQAEVVIDPLLLDEVTALVEWPVALCGRFDESFLDVPEEALISAMKSHQRYFHMVDGNGRLLPRFVTIANIDSLDPTQVVAGNERVIVPRLSDAAFFFEQDCKTSLADKAERLKSVVFQSKLGTYYDKAERVAHLADDIEGLLGADTGAPRAGWLCKADLVTDMVSEFPDLQGIMGAYYARHDGEPETVATAIGEHYRPTQSGGAIPSSQAGRIIAIADKLDTLTGLFGIGQPPTGSRDPFALRRQSLGVLRILIEAGMDLDLVDLIERASHLHNQRFDAAPLREYMLERLAVFYSERGIQTDTFEAARHADFEGLRLPEFDRRVRAIQAFRGRPEAASLAAANKRVANLLKQVGADQLGEVDSDRLTASAESELLAAVNAKETALTDLTDFDSQLLALAELQTVVDKYFDDVLVMDEDPAVRNNRLATLARMRRLFLRVADVSILQI
ncbi:MAG: glycine--tRNA ligase subunit beta [Gammaproteobacteria bacterium]|nr:glycine--tRNA ligase subunit beta [Gammaproteobacteria bacterium]